MTGTYDFLYITQDALNQDFKISDDCHIARSESDFGEDSTSDCIDDYNGFNTSSYTENPEFTECSLFDACTTSSDWVNHVLLKNAFRKWVISYHNSVRETVLQMIVNIYYKRRYVSLVFKAFFVLRRRKKLKLAIKEAESFSLNVVLTRWKDFAEKNKAFRSNKVYAKIFHQSSVAMRTISTLKSAVALRKECEKLSLRLVDIIERHFSLAIIRPWYNQTKREKRLELCFKDINSNNILYNKDLILALFNFHYNYRTGVKLLSSLILQFVKRRALHKLCEYRNVLLEKEDAVVKGLWKLTTQTCFDHWRYLVMDKIASNLRKSWLESKAFHILKKYAAHKRLVSKKISLARTELNTLCQKNVLTKMYNRILSKNRLISALDSISFCANISLKRHAFYSLFYNSKIIEADIRHDLVAKKFMTRSLYKRYMNSLRTYAESKRGKSDMLALATISYNRYILSSYFGFMHEFYLERRKNVDSILASFSSRRRHFLLLRSFTFFVRGINRIRRLNEVQDSIQSLHQLSIASFALSALSFSISRKLYRKIITLASVCTSDVSELEKLTISDLDSINKIIECDYSNVDFYSQGYPCTDVSKSFINDKLAPLWNTKVSGNVLYNATFPMNSECRAFLFLLLNFKAKYRWIIDTYSFDNDDFFTCLYARLNNVDLSSIRSSHTLLLHQAKLDYLSPSSAVSCDEYTPLNMQDTFEDYPLEIRSLLHSMIFSKLFHLQDSSMHQFNLKVRKHENMQSSDAQTMSSQTTVLSTPADEGPSSGDFKILDLLRLKLPLWRLISYKLLSRFSLRVFKEWRTIITAKREKRLRDLETTDNVRGISNMINLINVFNEWLRITREESEIRKDALVSKCKRFVSILEYTIFAKKRLVYLRLHLNFVISKYSGIERSDQLVSLLKGSIQFGYHGECLDLLREYRTYTNFHIILLRWLMHTRWTTKVRTEANEFARLNFLIKSWRTWRNATIIRQENRRAAEELITTEARSISLSTHFEEWVKSKRCRNVLESFTPVRVCFYNWKSLAATNRRLRHVSDFISHQSDKMILDFHINQWLSSYNNVVEYRMIVENCRKTYFKKRLLKCFNAWYDCASHSKRLGDCRDDLESHSNGTIKSHYYQLLVQICTLRRMEKSRILNNVLVTLRLVAASSKLYKVLESGLKRSDKHALMESINLLRVNLERETMAEVVMKNETIYSALSQLSNLPKYRTDLAINVLRTNANEMLIYKRVKALHYGRLTKECFNNWKKIAQFYTRWVNPLYGTLELEDENDAHEHQGEYRDIYFIRCQYLILKSRSSLQYWRAYSNALPVDKFTLSAIDDFVCKNRILASLRVLSENAMEKKWHSFCSARATDFAESRQVRLKHAMFSTWRELVHGNVLEE
ncbi:conserved hypothetical protein [Theileria equi strain WA]|uniref:Sfi1 spindle body domain-containing protein n=1 Tax=Theileria equi strain WA TaxID=1537102 RepID=L1LBV7_THEEQ|nr:conserved hypothetical protein [Theileria equi strain WA]EKX72663.1 conserved hypothetical protein [Theileria equi strain WA]|eukprot:XP_004832115.1 conserved hypothetical protein [Theileria equi strain WA]